MRRARQKNATDLNGLSEKPDDVKRAEQQEEEWEAMQMEDEEDGQAWAQMKLVKLRQASPRTWKARRKMQSTQKKS